MKFEPGSLDGIKTEIFSDGKRVGEAVLEDRRYVYDRRERDQVFLHIQEYLPALEKRLPRPFSGETEMLKSLPVDLRLENGTQIIGAEIRHPWVDRIGASVGEIPFQLILPDR